MLGLLQERDFEHDVPFDVLEQVLLVFFLLHAAFLRALDVAKQTTN